MATTDQPVAHPVPPVARPSRRAELTTTDIVVRSLLGVAACIPAAALGFLVYEMTKQAWPSIVFNGFGFFTHQTFSFGNGGYSSAVIKHHGYTAPGGSSFGVLVMLWGTLISSILAMIFAIPVAVGGALFLVERLPRALQGWLGIFLEMLAGIPSVVFGLWGYLTLGPFLARTVYPVIADLHIPWFSRPILANQGLLTASLVLAAMVIPIVASTTRELIRSVPGLTKEGAVAMGLTPQETVGLVTLPIIRTGIIAASILGWGRALGETIAVEIISGVVLNGYPHSIFSAFATMASAIANLVDASVGVPMAPNALAEVGLVLLVVTLLTNLGGRLITTRLGGSGMPVGRGI